MNEKYQKVSKFKCENCNYYCDEKSNYKKHLKTKKHTEKMEYFSGSVFQNFIPVV